MSKPNIDRIFINGRIYPVDESRSWHQAMAIGDGRIQALGRDEEVRALAGENTETVNLQQQMVMPGLVDVHNHILNAGLVDLFEIQLPPEASLEQILDTVRHAAEQNTEGRWLIGGQISSERLYELDNARTLAALDEASLGHPVMLREESLHNAWVNSRALAEAGVAANATDPARGRFSRDATSGQLTGVVIEAAAGLIERVATQSMTEATARQAIQRAIEILNAHGVTAFQDAASLAPIGHGLRQLDADKGLTAHAVLSLPLVEPPMMPGTAGEPLLAMRDQFASRRVHINYTKLFLDGVPAARTAAFHQPYLPDPNHAYPDGHRGEMLVTLPELVRWIDRAEDLDLGLKIHCTGDASVTRMLDAVETVRHFRGPARVRHHIAHASYIRSDDIPRFAELGVVGDLCPMMWYPTTFLEAHRQVLGAERGERFWPIADLQASGALLAGGSDWPVAPVPNPWLGIEGMVTRANPAGQFPGETLWPEQAIDLATAIEIYTINAARAAGIGEHTGSLTPGKSADFVVLDRCVFDIPANELAETRVLTTYFEGQSVYQA